MLQKPNSSQQPNAEAIPMPIARGETNEPQMSQARLAVLTHYLPPYMARVLQHVSVEIPQLQVLLSIPLEPNRNYAIDWGDIDVRVQKSLMLRRPWKHKAGFQDELFVHVPYDTLGQLRKIRPDIIFSFELGFRSFASALYRMTHRKTRLAICVCVSEHTEHGRGSARWFLRRALVRMADAITYNGPSCKRYLERLGVPEHRLFPFPYAADDRTEPTHSTHIQEPNKRLLVVGQLSQRKGIGPLLDALSTYCEKHKNRIWDLTLVGTGPLEEELRLRKYPLNLQITFRGHVSPADLATQWQSYGVLLFPTLADEWGLVVNEALRAGLPVLGSKYAQSCTSLIREGVNGWIYAPDEPGDLESALDRIWDLSANQLSELRQNARRSVAGITSHAAADNALTMLRELYFAAK